MDETADTGDVVVQKKCNISRRDTGGELREKLFDLSVEMLRESLPKFRANELDLTYQNHEEATYFGPRRPEDSVIDWSKTTDELYDFIRALAPPFPPAYTFCDGRKVRITKASKLDDHFGVTGSVVKKIDGEMVIATADSALLIEGAHYEDTGEYPQLRSGTKFEGEK